MVQFHLKKHWVPHRKSSSNTCAIWLVSVKKLLTWVLKKKFAGSRLTSEAAETPIENLDLSVRVFNSLKRTGITTVGDVLELLEKGDEAVMSIRNFGEKSLDELREKMQEKGFLHDEKDVE